MRRLAMVVFAAAFLAAGCDGTSDPPATTTAPEATTSTSPGVTTTEGTAVDAQVVLSGEEEFPDGFTVPAGETWVFDPDADTTVVANANVIVEGTLEMQPASGDVEHVLRFEGIDESSFAGGGMDPVASDTGLWVVGDGRLDIQGEEKIAWAYEYDPEWEGDEVVAAPNTPGDYETFESVTSTPPPNELGYPTELLNLTRNVRIEGTPDGYTHVFIRSNRPQHIRHAVIRYVGPRFGDTDATGRYGLHVHMSGDGTRGSIVEGVVIRDAGNHAFVPHASHGMTFRDTIAYQVENEAYWWDMPTGPLGRDDYDPLNDTDDLIWDRAVAAGVSEGFAGSRFRLAAFSLANGNGLTLTNSVAVGLDGEFADRSGFTWPEPAGSTWTFEGNVAHNNESNGIFVWQNSRLQHLIDDFTAYYNGRAGVNHGAYGNAYQYDGLVLLDNEWAVISHALGEANDVTDTQTWSGLQTEGGDLLITEHATEAEAPVRFVDCDLGAVVVEDVESPERSEYEFIRCGLEPDDFDVTQARADSTFRVQRADGTAYELLGDSTVTEIEPFYSD